MQDDEYAELFKKLPPKSSGSSWQDVATEFENLGKTFADVIRSAWKQSEGDATLTQLRDGLETVIDGIRRTSEGTPETAQARDQLVRLVESIREAVTQASEDVRPELVSLLRQANSELRKLGRMDDEDPDAGA
jgi:ABC-type transporter Mla subunit MlaD